MFALSAINKVTLHPTALISIIAQETYKKITTHEHFNVMMIKSLPAIVVDKQVIFQQIAQIKAKPQLMQRNKRKRKVAQAVV